ncbi:MAG: zinc ribbon domain-containing protein [Thermodesulfobacteriota bacterium]
MDEMKFCYSCGAPLNAPGFKGVAENFCKYCTDDQGRVKSRPEVQAGIAQWLKMWQPNLDDAQAIVRAGHYMKAMPHWAE